jgi:NAD(P)-dependent dehydrogenase (short-subunit alcohol dehydrogenase family)
MSIQGKVSVITGAAAGIGMACAKRFLEEGARVVLADLDQERGEQSLRSLGASPSEALFVPCDAGDAGQIANLIGRAVARFGRLDNVIANAGIIHTCDPLELREEDLDRVLRVNLKGVILLGQAAAKVMLEQAEDTEGSRGTIINMSSVNAVMAIPEISSYCVAKGGVNQWTRALSIRLAPYAIRVNGIGPGSIATEMFQAVAGDPDKLARVLSRTPMGRPGQPDEVAKAAVFLASSYSSYMSGQTLYPDGGRLGLNYTV